MNLGVGISPMAKLRKVKKQTDTKDLNEQSLLEALVEIRKRGNWFTIKPAYLVKKRNRK